MPYPLAQRAKMRSAVVAGFFPGRRSAIIANQSAPAAIDAPSKTLTLPIDEEIKTSSVAPGAT
jgi:hypothetical protein